MRRGPLLVFALGVPCLTGCNGDGRPRNLVMICLDTVRYDTFFLPEQIDAPDALSPRIGSALRFEAALAPSPWTLPSVASALTGRYPPRHGAGYAVGADGKVAEEMPNWVRDDIPALPQILERAGHRIDGYSANLYMHPFPELRDAGSLQLELDAPRGELLAWTGEWLAEHGRSEPFSLFLHLMDAHNLHLLGDQKIAAERAAAIPSEMRESVRRLAPEGLCPVPPERAPGCVAYLAYVSEVLGLREAVASVLELLEREGLARETLVVVFSDHGEAFGEHEAVVASRRRPPRLLGAWGHGHSLFRELLHVPFLVWHPGLEGREITSRVSLVDVLPSVLEWLGIELPEDASQIQGRSLASLARGEPRGGERPLYASGIAEGAPQEAVVRGRWKRIQLHRPEARLLFDVVLDPEERSALERPEIAAEFDRLLEAYRESEVAQRSERLSLTPEELRGLQAIGYLEDAASEETPAP